MGDLLKFNLSPQLIVGRSDHRVLSTLAFSGGGMLGDEFDGLLSELERARVVEDEAVPTDVVRMGSSVRYRSSSGDERTVTLCYPKDADISSGSISVLTPIGTALVGLRVGQSIRWKARDGRQHVLTVLEVLAPRDDRADTDPPPAA